MKTKLIEIIERGSIPASNLSNIETRLLHSIAFERKEEKKRSQTCVFFSKQEMHHFISIFYFVFFDSKLMPIFNEWLTTNKRICHLPPPPSSQIETFFFSSRFSAGLFDVYTATTNSGNGGFCHTGTKRNKKVKFKFLLSLLQPISLTLMRFIFCQENVFWEN